MNDQTRNIHPIPEAVFAMFHWHMEYASQSRGAMDFYNLLTEQQKRYCENAIKRINDISK